ncbi:glycosyltransferase, partial [Cellulomonas sp. ACRRI]|uniref:glycosyltransferase family 2 protein n=1 Tax=Cellulomonas sp. ACRRI TaxID=2918188 RepID=UPI001EF3CE16
MTDVRARADVSVVLVARGDEHGLALTLRGLLASLDHAAGRREDRTAWLRGERLHGEVLLVARDLALLPRLPADPRLRVVAAPGVTGGRARNVGVAAARGRYLLFTDPQVRVPADWVLALTAPLRAGRADLVGGAVRLAANLERPWLTEELAAAYLDLVPDPPEVGGAFSGISMAASRAVLEAVGFDEALGTARCPDAS